MSWPGMIFACFLCMCLTALSCFALVAFADIIETLKTGKPHWERRLEKEMAKAVRETREDLQ